MEKTVIFIFSVIPDRKKMDQVKNTWKVTVKRT